MEGGSVLSPSSWEKRRAWARQSRCWRTTVVEEEAAAAMQDVPELQPPHLDDVFLEGSSSSKIETWLQDCGSSLEALPEELGLPGPYGCGSSGTSFEDDLTLGAEALLLPGNDRSTGRALRGKHLHLGHSMASSALSSVTNKTSSSISEILEWWQADAEEILYNLGFVQSEPGAVARVPARFFSAPSQAKGIDFQLFLKAQVRRLEMEDPCLMLATPSTVATDGSWACVTPEQPGHEGDSGFGSGPLGTSPRRREGTKHPGDSPDPRRARSPQCHHTTDGGQRAWRSRGQAGDLRDAGWRRRDAPGLQPTGKGPTAGGSWPLHPSWAGTRRSEAVGSFELEEVLSASEDDGDAREDDGDGSAREEAGRSTRTRRCLVPLGDSGHSDSSGFAEEPPPEQRA